MAVKSKGSARPAPKKKEAEFDNLLRLAESFQKQQKRRTRVDRPRKRA
jgi:hypothetical protein